MKGRGQPADPRGKPVDQLADGPGVSHIDPNAPAAPNYKLVARLRGALSLREMIQPVRTGYLGQDGPIDPKLLLPHPEQLFPNVIVTQFFTSSPDGPMRCEVFRPEGLPRICPGRCTSTDGGASCSAGRRIRSF
jgi:hypothetical protein